MPRLVIVSAKKKSSGKRKATPPKSPTKTGAKCLSAQEKRNLRKLKDVAKLDVKRKNEALRRLGVPANQVEIAPGISALLKQAYGGIKTAIEAMRFSYDISIVTFLQKYDNLPARDRDSLPLEAICIAAMVDPTRLLGATILALQNYSASTVKIIALSHHPELMRKRAEFGMKEGGLGDRNVIDQGLGFTPTAKGSTFIINPGGMKQIDGGKKDDKLPPPPAEEEETDLQHLFPSLSETQTTLVPLKVKRLTS